MEKKIEIAQSSKQTLKQGLILSGKMQLSLKVMQLPVLDLRTFIFNELEKNVALELVKDRYEEQDITIYEKQNNRFNGNSGFIENISYEFKSLQSNLLSQINIIKAETSIIKLAKLIIQNLDDKGFNIVPFDELFASQAEIKNITKEKIRKAINIVRGLEPRGCAFENINKSLLFQLYLSYQKLTKPLDKKTKRIYRLAIKVIHLAFPFAERGLEKHIKEKLKKVGIKIKAFEIIEVLDLIKTLKLYPGYLCETTNVNNNYIVPDVYVGHEEGEIKITTNKNVLPVIKISHEIEALSKKDLFAFESVKKAQELISAINERKSTLLRVVEAITIFQRDFFYYGISYLSPLRQKDVAQELNISASTVSRIASNKYLYCKWGLFRIGYFFTQKATSNIATEFLNPKATYVSSGFSKQACKEMIKSIIENNSSIPDREIGKELSKRGVSISRRTIAKYREELGIKSSHKR
ncbi:MAG: RNA polymerase factor sigma-54 [Treponema sp.]